MPAFDPPREEVYDDDVRFLLKFKEVSPHSLPCVLGEMKMRIGTPSFLGGVLRRWCICYTMVTHSFNLFADEGPPHTVHSLRSTLGDAQVTLM